MIRSSASRGRGPARSFDLGQLPDRSQALICSLVSTSSCPAQPPLASVSKSWGAAAERSLQGGVSIALNLTAGPDSTTQQQQREAERLESLALWLRRYGHTVKSLIVRTNDVTSEEGYVAWRSEAVRQVVTALAETGQQNWPLPLQVLRLPAIGGTDPETLSSALTVCPYLHHLRLDYCYGDETIHPVSYLAGDTALPAALHGLQHLTHLKLSVTMSEYICGERQVDLARMVAKEPHPNAPNIPIFWGLDYRNNFQPDPFPPHQQIHLDSFFLHLPASLENLELNIPQLQPDSAKEDKDPKQSKQQKPPRQFHLRTSSLLHLMSLAALKLPGHLHIHRSDAWGDTLPSLVSLEYPWALVTQGAALLPLLPNLEVLRGGLADPACLAQLVNMPSLRSLQCRPVLTGDGVAAATAIARLTQLQHLSAEVVGDPGVCPAAAAHWGRALSSLTGLHTLLRLPVEILEQVDFAALPALLTVSIYVNRTLCKWVINPSTTVQLLQQLAPARGRLRRVVLHQAPPGMRQALGAMVSAAVGRVRLAFLP